MELRKYKIQDAAPEDLLRKWKLLMKELQGGTSEESLDTEMQQVAEELQRQGYEVVLKGNDMQLQPL